MRTVGEILAGRTSLLTARPDQTVADVARKLATHNIGALPVVEGAKLAGILSERDIIDRIVALEKDPKTVFVKDIMTPNPVTVEETQTLTEALRLMSEHRFRHLPVLRAGQLVGVISLRDLLQVQLAAQEKALEVLSALPDREFE